MLSGVKEILIIGLVLLGLFLIPRLTRRGGGTERRQPVGKSADRRDGGLIRLAVLLSGLWLALAFILLNPLKGAVAPFLGAGILPIAAGWGLRWVWLGFKK